MVKVLVAGIIIFLLVRGVKSSGKFVLGLLGAVVVYFLLKGGL